MTLCRAAAIVAGRMKGEVACVGYDFGGEGVVDFAAERLVAVEPRAAAQEPHTVGQVGAHGRVAAIDVNLVDRLDFE